MQRIRNPKQGFQCITQCTTHETLDEGFARSVPLCREDILHLMYRKQRTITYAHEQLLTERWRYTDIFHMDMQQRSLLKIESPQGLIGIKRIIDQLLENIDIPFVSGPAGCPVE